MIVAGAYGAGAISGGCFNPAVAIAIDFSSAGRDIGGCALYIFFELLGARKGTTGVSTNGVTANFIFLGRGTFWVLPLTYFYLPNRARAYLFPRSVKIRYFCSGPITADPICPQPITADFYFNVETNKRMFASYLVFRRL